MAEWTSNRNYATRIENIRGTGSGTRSNGNIFLQKNVTVWNDLSSDLLSGDAGRDWFFAFYDDSITGKNGSEISE